MKITSHTEVCTESLQELQLKFKLLYLKDVLLTSSEQHNTHKKELSLKILYYLNLKKIVSGKATNRIIRNYFKHFFSLLNKDYLELVDIHKTSLDKNYVLTTAIQPLYDLDSG